MADDAPRAWKTDPDNRVAEMSVFVTVGGEPVLAGVMTFRGRRGGLRQGLFRYDQNWLVRASARPLFAHGLPLRRVTQSLSPHEVPLAFYDASPDGWGKALLRTAYPDIQLGTPDYIAAAGNDRVGNLQVGPDDDGPSVWVPAPAMLDLAHDEDDLVDLMDAADAFENGVATKSHLARLLDSGAAIGGARPKARLLVDGESWLVKLRASGDLFDMQRVEASVGCGAGRYRHTRPSRPAGGRAKRIINQAI